MGNKKYVFNVLPTSEVHEMIKKYPQSLRIELCEGSPHLEIMLKDGNRKYFKTIGRIRKNVFRKLPIVLMDVQPNFVNVAWYKFVSNPNR